ncbi:MAG: hypothetical protein K2X64_01370 [Rhodocyclaceae bacterium]|nr:hypothetical protein [Rhodocyclaceae bacterium]
MRWPHTNSRIAVGARRLRSRFGIAAPRMTVRSQLPWHWRAASVIVITAASLALAGWIYDAGRSIAGFKNSLMDSLKLRASEQETELVQLRSAAASSAARLQIEQAAQEQLKKQLGTLEAENARLKEELAVFESMARGQGVEGSLSISRLRIEPSPVAGTYTYKMLVTRQQSKRDAEFRGGLQFILTVQQASGNAMIVLPKTGEPETSRFQVAFRQFHRLEGTFSIPEGAHLIAVEARLLQEGAVKASQRITL